MQKFTNDVTNLEPLDVNLVTHTSLDTYHPDPLHQCTWKTHMVVKFSSCQIVLKQWAIMGNNDGLPTAPMHMLRWMLDGHTSAIYMDKFQVTWVLPVHRCPKAKEACLSTIFCMFNVQISSIHTNRHKVTPCLWKGCVSTSIRYMFILIYKRTTSTPHNVATLNRLICVRWRLVLKPIVTQNTISHLKVQLVLEH